MDCGKIMVQAMLSIYLNGGRDRDQVVQYQKPRGGHAQNTMIYRSSSLINLTLVFSVLGLYNRSNGQLT